MFKNIIYYFSGTGNCLQIAKEIAITLSDCEIKPMGKTGSSILETSYESIGFVYPTYFQGIPLAVQKFVSELNLSKNKTAYFYAVTTYGGLAGNALPQMAQLLNNKEVTLHYGAKLIMFSNYIVLYKMSDKKKEKTERAIKDLQPILKSIQHRENNAKEIQRANLIYTWYYNWRAKQIPEMDRHFNISSACTSCGICQNICPVQNITLKNGRPLFQHHCEQCMACIQFCPKQAINYKQLTQNRGRYTHPAISYKELSEKNKNL